MEHTLQLDPWTAVGEPPVDGSPEELVQCALRCAILGPSTHNTQPWRFRVEDGTIELFADRSRALPVVDPDHRALIMSCGAALFQIRVALRAAGREPLVTRLPKSGTPDLLARVELGPEIEPSDDDRELFDAITERRTNRQPFEHRPLPKRLTQELRHVVADEGAQLVTVSAHRYKHELAELIAEGDRRQWDDKHFRHELAAWNRSNHSQRGDGIPGYGLGQGDVTSLVGPLMIHTFDLGGGQAARDQDLADGSPALAVLFTDWEGPAEWLAAGEALGHLLLRAQAAGVSASFLNQPVEDRTLRPRLRKLLGERGFPQLVLGLGYPHQPARATPRRALQDVVL